jgi:hypothetical protein
MRAVAIAAALLAALPALAGGRSASFRVGAQVVSSARFSSSASAAGLRFESRSFGGSGAAILVQQRSGAPMRLLDGTPLPREDQQPLVVPAAARMQLALAPASGGEVVVVTLFPDGAPPKTAATRN